MLVSAEPPQVYSRLGIDVSCVSQDFCGALGLAQDARGRESALLLVRQSGVWQNISVAPEGPYWRAELVNIDCPAEGFCVAVGSYRTDQYTKHAWAVRYENGVVSTYLDTLAAYTVAYDISCSSTQYCAAEAYTYSIEDGEQAHLISFADGYWQEELLMDDYSISSLDCYQDGMCMLAGRYIIAKNNSIPIFGWYQDGELETESVILDHTSISSLSLAGCNPQYCMARVIDIDHRVVQRTEAGQWLTVQDEQGLSTDAQSVRWNGMTCLGVDDCTLVGVVGSRESWVMNGPNDSPQAVHVQPPTKDSYGSSLGKVSCASKQFCVAIGMFANRTIDAGNTRIFIAEYDGTTWRSRDPFAEIAAPETPRTFVAFGDSITTGGAIHSCVPDRAKYAWGCPPDATITPYPDILQKQLGYANEQYHRVGIWGYTVSEAASAHRRGYNTEGSWQTQVQSIKDATGLVTGSLGVNDLQFSNVFMWIRQYAWSRSGGVSQKARELLNERGTDFDLLFQSLSTAKNNGADVVVTLYYNPFSTQGLFCSDLRTIGDTLVGELNQELQTRASLVGVKTADFRDAFEGHGAGSDESYVLGQSCDALSAARAWLPEWVNGRDGNQAIAERFDPHPNQRGTTAMAQLIKEEL